MAVLLPIHIASAAAGLVAGTVALVVRKGSRAHRRSGLVFVCTMLAMCASAVVLAVAKGQTVNAVAGTLTAYLVITALTTVRPRRTESRVTDVVLMTVAFALA